ncbi:MAG: phage antirepressor KilAC domain-containing protein [Oscillospiraceae bacterium]|jgi:prophage antirepressor-like protein|nr:phage antirepressor KilAC domain-containing protein [Oscillospiraceae bacterium]
MQKNQIQCVRRSAQHTEFGELEVLMIGEKPYFPATESAVILGYKNPHDAVLKHCKGDALVNREVIDSLGRKQKVKFIPEGDLYRLIIRSKLLAAEQFERWVFDEVLPTIRKHGAYVTDELLKRLADKTDEADALLNALKRERQSREFVETFSTALVPKARYYDVILQCKEAIAVSVIAKDYGMTAVKFNRMLRDAEIQYKIRGTWLLRNKYSNCGYTVSRTYHLGNGQTAIHTYWTQRGRKFLYDFLKEYDFLPEIERRDCMS